MHAVINVNSNIGKRHDSLIYFQMPLQIINVSIHSGEHNFFLNPDADIATQNGKKIFHKTFEQH